MYSQHINTFIIVADSGSFTKAAEKLFITTVSVMKQINSFEKHIGVKLLIRSHQGVKLTKAGEEIYKAGKEIIKISNSAIQKIQKDKSKSIRIGTSLLYPCNHLVELWRNSSNPNTAIKINIVPMGDSYTNLISLSEEIGKSIDCFVAGYDAYYLLKNCSIFPLFECPCSIYVPKNHSLANKKILKWKDLSGENLMLVKKGHSPTIDKIRNEIKTKHKNINIIDVQSFYSAQVFNECVAKGYLMEIPSIWANIHPSLVSIPVEWDYKLKFGIIYHKKPDKYIKTFINRLQNFKFTNN